LASASSRSRPTVALLDGALRFRSVARYRKESPALDDAQFAHAGRGLNYLRELEERRTAILIQSANRASSMPPGSGHHRRRQQRTPGRHLPAVQPKRRTKAEIAKEPASSRVRTVLTRAKPIRKWWPQVSSMPTSRWPMWPRRSRARVRSWSSVSPRTPTDRHACGADVVERTRSVHRAAGARRRGREVQDYFRFREPLHKLPSHRILAMFRGEKEEILELQMARRAKPPCSRP